MRSLSIPIIEICGMIFEWHDPKYELVLSKHKITLEEVASVFSDDFAVEIEDIGGYNEQRMVVVGMSNQARLLVIVYTERANTVRIITACFPSYNNAQTRF